MNIITRIFGGTVETNDVVEELAAEEQRQRELQAEQIARERRQTIEYRARIAAALAEFLKRKDANGKEVNAHVVALLLALTDTRKLVLEAANIPFDGTVSTVEEVFGFPVEFADKLIAVIHEAAPRTQWDFSGEGQPKLKGPQEIRLPRFPADMKAPPGFVGAWDMLRGQPVDPSEEVPFAIIPNS